MDFKSYKASIEAKREAKHKHFVIVGTVFAVISITLFSLEMLGIGGVTGVVGVILVGIADL